MRNVLENCSLEVLQDMIGSSFDKIYSVGREIGFNQKKFGAMLEKLIS